MSILLQATTRFLLRIMLVLSVLLVLRGHNYPGGGFIGALVATSAIALYTLAFGLKPTGFDRWAPKLLALGLVCLGVSFAWPLLLEHAPLTGLWTTLSVVGQSLKLGTPLIFDFGIYFLIVGSLSWLIAELEDKQS